MKEKLRSKSNRIFYIVKYCAPDDMSSVGSKCQFSMVASSLSSPSAVIRVTGIFLAEGMEY